MVWRGAGPRDCCATQRECSAGSGDATEAARDVVQDTWVGAIQGLRGLRDPAEFRAWIYGIATRKCADQIRSHMRRRRFDTGSGEATPVATLTAEQRIDLTTAIRELPPIHRAAVHLFYAEDLSVEEIAAVLKIPAGTVKSRLHHAREALKNHLGAAAPVRNAEESSSQEIL